MTIPFNALLKGNITEIIRQFAHTPSRQDYPQFSELVPHVARLSGIPCWDIWCLFRSPFREARWGQLGHANGLSPVCTLMWRTKSDFFLNAFWQYMHSLSFPYNSSLRWIFRVLLVPWERSDSVDDVVKFSTAVSRGSSADSPKETKGCSARPLGRRNVVSTKAEWLDCGEASTPSTWERSEDVELEHHLFISFQAFSNW